MPGEEDVEADLPMSLVFLLMVVVLALTVAFSSARAPPLAEPFANYSRCAPVQGIIKEIFAANGMMHSDEDWQLYYPCTYTHVESELRKLNIAADKTIYAVDGCDMIASKNLIWTRLVQAHGRAASAAIMPETYLAADPAELRAFLAAFSPRHMYICKKNVQRKQGLMLTNNLDQLLQCQHRGFKVIQRYFKDVFLLGGRKLNLRVYVLVICDIDGRRTAYVHRNGKCMYTNRPYARDSVVFEEQITSVNLDPSVYKTLPLDFVALRRALRKRGVCFDRDVFEPTVRKLQLVMDAVLPALCAHPHLRRNLRFQLFGADVILTDTLDPYVLEFNKGPEMRPVNHDDYALKRGVLEDTLRMAGVLPHKSIARVNGYRTLRELPTG